jgi:hypothetical protein
LRSEAEMRELVVAKVAAHRRRRRQAGVAVGSAGTALALAVALVVGGSTGPDDSVKAGPGDVEPLVTTTTGAPDPTDDPTTTAPPVPNVPQTVATTTGPAPTSSTTTTTAPSLAFEPIVLRGSDGDLDVIVTLSADPGRPDELVAHVQASDPTAEWHGDQVYGLYISLSTVQDTDGYGDPGEVDNWVHLGTDHPRCGDAPFSEGLGPVTIDEAATLTRWHGAAHATLLVKSAMCTTVEATVVVEQVITLP